MPKPSPLATISAALVRASAEPKLKSIPSGVLLGDGAHLVELHGRRHRGAEGDGVEAVLVADEVGVGQGIEVVDARVRPHGPGRLVLEPAGVAPVLGLVLDGEVTLVDGGDAPAGDGAAEAGGVGGQIGLAVALARLVHGLAGDVRGTLELDLAHVAGRQGADLVDDVHQHLGAVGRQSLAGDRVLRQHLLARAHCLP